MLSIKVLEPDCDNCYKVEALAKPAVTSLGVEATIVKITDDPATGRSFGMDLTPLINNLRLSLDDFVQGLVQHFAQDISAGLTCLG